MRPLLVSLAFTAAVAVSGCGGDAVPEIHQTVAASGGGILVDTATIVLPVSLPAQLYVEHDAPVMARTAGVIESVYVDLGTPVKEGDLLARLESTDQQIALARAREKAANTARTMVRLRALAESGYASPADSEQAGLEASQAALALRQAQRDYDLTRVTAPFTGVVTRRIARPRRLVSEGDSLFRVTALAPLLASLNLPESDAASVTVGAETEIEAMDGRRLPGRVVRASPVIDAASGTREIVVQVSGRSGLRPGSSVTVHLGAERRRVIAVPRSLVKDENYLVVLENGRAVMRQVRFGAELPDGRVEVISGLAPGERLASTESP